MIRKHKSMNREKKETERDTKENLFDAYTICIPQRNMRTWVYEAYDRYLGGNGLHMRILVK